jgi:hypothetical protein
MALPQLGAIPGSSTLDGPPPSPAQTDGMNPGMPLDALMGPQGKPPVPSTMIDPKVITSLLAVINDFQLKLPGYQQVTPDLAPDWAIVNAALGAVMSKLQLAGGGPTSPNAPGSQFPGGGMDTGGFPPLSPQG